MQPDAVQIENWNKDLKDSEPKDILTWVTEHFDGAVAFASSMGMEDQVITDLISKVGSDIPIFTLDTGRLFPETYELIEQTEQRYQLKIKVFFPDSKEVEQMVQAHGINLFRSSVLLRKECCRIRKVEPLRRSLAGLRAWVTGLRREQSMTREELQLIEWDAANGMVKINPLANWTTQQVLDHIATDKVPYHPLHDQSFPTIGCACCTRAVAPGEDIRAGRWWWESAEHRECGLHPNHPLIRDKK